MNAPEQREVVQALMRLVRAPQERAARVKAIIRERWRRELRRLRWRYFLAITVIVATAFLMGAIALRWIASGGR